MLCFIRGLYHADVSFRVAVGAGVVDPIAVPRYDEAGRRGAALGTAVDYGLEAVAAGELGYLPVAHLVKGVTGASASSSRGRRKGYGRRREKIWKVKGVI